MKTKNIVLACGLGAFFVLLSCFGFANIFKQESTSTKYKNWMSNLDDSTSIRNINMPGSHDTISLYSIGDVAGQCQSLSLEEQLNLGVRFIDVRLQEDNNKLKGIHGFVDQRITFKEITNTIERFITNNPSEFIIMSIKEEKEAKKSTISFEEAVKSYLTSDIYLKGNEIPDTLGSVRGKVAILSRYSNSTIGIPAYDGWADSNSFTLPNDIYVQDTYKVTSKEQKQNEIINCFQENGHKLKINFLSAYRTNYIPPSYAPSVALDINPWINTNISNYSDRGIVLYDFINEENMNAFFKGVYDIT